MIASIWSECQQPQAQYAITLIFRFTQYEPVINYSKNSIYCGIHCKKYSHLIFRHDINLLEWATDVDDTPSLRDYYNFESLKIEFQNVVNL